MVATISTFPLSSSAKQVVSTHKISSLVVPFLSRDPTNCANSDLGFRVGAMAGEVVVALTQAGFLDGHGGPWLQGWSWGWFLMWHPTLWQIKHLLYFIYLALSMEERWMALMSMALESYVILERKDLMLPPPWRAVIYFCWAWNLLACLIHSFSIVGISLTDRTIYPRLGSSPVAKASIRVSLSLIPICAVANWKSATYFWNPSSWSLRFWTRPFMVLLALFWMSKE